jgi:hypothetical protein
VPGYGLGAVFNRSRPQQDLEDDANRVCCWQRVIRPKLPERLTLRVFAIDPV